MPQAAATKRWNQFNKGINSEQSEINMEDGFSTDEANYELLTDGSRKRRRGLTQEAGGGTVTVNSFNATAATSQAFVWRNAGGQPDKNFIVHKVGSTLYFTDDSDGGSATVRTESFELDDYRVNNTNSNEAVAADFSQGRGVLFVSTQHNYPLWIEYDATNDTFTNGVIKIQIRDYQDIEDGVPLDTQVPSGQAGSATAADLATDFPQHRYNLLNRGWSDAQVVAYENAISGTARYPAKVHAPIQAYKLIEDSTTYTSREDKTGDYTFSAATLDAFPHTGSSAPKGSMLLSIFNDTKGFKEVSVDGSATEVEYDGGAAVYAAGPPETLTATDVVVTDNGDDTYTFQVTETGHSLSAGDEVRWIYGPDLVTVTGSWAYTKFSVPEFVTVDAGPGVNDWSFTVTGNGTDFSTITTIGVTYSTTYQFKRYGYTPVVRSSGTGPATVGPKAVEFHGGRLFYAGMPDTEWADYIFYSQVVQKSRNYNRCHTEADPTAYNFNSPTAADGGFLVIPNIGNVKKLLSYENALLIFSDQGVWEVQGKGTFFDPSDYRVRKITDAECGSAYAPLRVEGVVIYTGPKGVYTIAPDQYTRQLTATNISDDRIREKWNAIGDTYEPYVKTAYDDAKKRVYFLQPGVANASDALVQTADAGIGQFSVIWIFDLRVGAWYKYEFYANTQTNAIIHAFPITGQDSSSSNRKMKFAVQKSATTFILCDLDDSGYTDFDGNIIPAFVLTAYDNIGDFSLRKQAPIVTVFSKRTETGYTATGNGWSADNESSTLMEARWDWSDDSVTGKVGSSNEVYRHVRGFVPSGATDEDGYPVVVTRNKVRGRGRALQLKFTAPGTIPAKDSHILGFTIDYKVSRRK